MSALTAGSRTAGSGARSGVRAVSVVGTGTVQIHPEQPNGSRKPLYWWLLTSRRWTPPLPINAYVIEHSTARSARVHGQGPRSEEAHAGPRRPSCARSQRSPAPVRELIVSRSTRMRRRRPPKLVASDRPATPGSRQRLAGRCRRTRRDPPFRCECYADAPSRNASRPA